MSVLMFRVDLAQLEARDLRLLHVQALGELPLREIVLGPITDDRNRYRTCQHRPLPLRAELGVGAQLLDDQLVVGLHSDRVSITRVLSKSLAMA